MNKRTAFILSIFFFSFSFCAQEAFAGAWTVPKYRVWGEYYMKWDYAKRRFNEEWKKKPLNNNARSWEFIQEPKIEYGITDWLNALFSIEYKEGWYQEYGRPWTWGPFERKNNGVTNVKIGGKLRFIEKPVVVSTQTKVFIYPGYGRYHGDDPAFHNQPDIGKGDDAVEQRIMIGKHFDLPLLGDYKLPCYAGAETGYRWRTRHVCNDIPYFVEAGFWPVSWFLVKTELDGYKHHAGTGSIKESYGIWRIGGAWQVFGDSTLRKGDKLFNIELLYGMTVWGKNTTAIQEWTLKAQTQF